MSNKAFLMNYVHNKLAEDPEWGPTLVGAEYDKGWMDFVAQGYGANNPLPSIYDRYVYCWLHSGLCLGAILYTLIHVGQTPRANKHVEANSLALSSLPKPFRARFIPTSGRGYNTDGDLSWDQPIWVGQTLDDGKQIEETLCPGKAPLEVGAIESYRTLMHLIGGRYLARWAYNSKYIRLVYRRDVSWRDARIQLERATIEESGYAKGCTGPKEVSL